MCTLFPLKNDKTQRNARCKVYPTWNGGGTVKLKIIGADYKAASASVISGRAVMPLVSPVLILMAFFTLDLFFASHSWSHAPADADALLDVSDLLRFPASWRIAADLVLLAACGGFYSVPLNALLQHKADPEQVARAIAANNIVNSFAIAIGTVVSAQLMAHGFISAIGVFVLVAAVNFLTALYLLPIRSERLPHK